MRFPALESPFHTLSPTGTHNERMHSAITETGTAVMHGVNSTFFAVLILASSNSYIFRCLFKMFFGICVFGAAHGMILLPVLLSIFGPPSTAGPAKSQPSTAVHVIKSESSPVPTAEPVDDVEAGDKGRRVSPSELSTAGLSNSNDAEAK